MEDPVPNTDSQTQQLINNTQETTAPVAQAPTEQQPMYDATTQQQQANYVPQTQVYGEAQPMYGQPQPMYNQQQQMYQQPYQQNQYLPNQQYQQQPMMQPQYQPVQQVDIVQVTQAQNPALTRKQQKKQAAAAAAMHFDDPVDRLNFVRKVYLILTCQLTFTAGFVAMVMYLPKMQAWITYNWWMFFPVLTVLIGTEIAMICSRKLARKVPVNYILLFLFTFAESYFVANICAYYTATQVIAAASMTAGMVIGLTCYAFKTKTDFTVLGGLLWILGFTLMVMCIFWALLWYDSFLYPLLCVLVISLFGVYLVYDTQLIIGKGRYKLNVDDYILGALVLYADIITIFLYLLALFGRRN